MHSIITNNINNGFFSLLCLLLEHIAHYTKVKTSVSETAWRTQVLSDQFKDVSLLDDLTFQSRTFQTGITQYGHIMLKLHIMYFIRRWKEERRWRVTKLTKVWFSMANTMVQRPNNAYYCNITDFSLTKHLIKCHAYRW